jgi:hypothetical protein
MLLEAGTAFMILWRRPEGVAAFQAWLGLVLLAVIWLSTALFQVPQHNGLSRGFDMVAYRTLVASNWVRTSAWSGRSLLVLWMLANAVSR